MVGYSLCPLFAQCTMLRTVLVSHSSRFKPLDLVFDVPNRFAQILNMGIFVFESCAPEVLHCTANVEIAVPHNGDAFDA